MSDTDISDDAVLEATGRGWRGWWKLLDAWGAPEHSHAQIARFLAHEHGLSGWWSQMVTVQYERDHGLREIGETNDGFQMGAQKTFMPDPASAWTLLSSPEGIQTWLGPGAPRTLEEGASFRLDDGTICEVRVVAEGSHVRITWQPPSWSAPSTLQVRAVEATSGRGTVSFHHEHLPSAAEREAMIGHWKERLVALAKLADRRASEGAA